MEEGKLWLSSIPEKVGGTRRGFLSTPRPQPPRHEPSSSLSPAPKVNLFPSAGGWRRGRFRPGSMGGGREVGTGDVSRKPSPVRQSDAVQRL